MTVLKFDEWRALMRKIRDSEEPDRLKRPGVVYPAREAVENVQNVQNVQNADAIPSDSEAEQ